MEEKIAVILGDGMADYPDAEGLTPLMRAHKPNIDRLCAAGTAIFFSTHVLEVAEKLCNKIAIIKNGKLIAFGPIDDVRGDASLETFFLELTDTDAAGK